MGGQAARIKKRGIKRERTPRIVSTVVRNSGASSAERGKSSAAQGLSTEQNPGKGALKGRWAPFPEPIRPRNTTNPGSSTQRPS